MPLRDPLQDPAGDDVAQYRNGTSSSSRLSLGLPRSKLPKPAPSPNDPSSLGLRRRNEDDSIRSTDHDALSSRLSAMKAGYLPEEPWTELLYAGLSSGALNSGALNSGALNSGALNSGAPLERQPPYVNPPPVLRRPPVINIGTNLRCRSLDAVVESFIAICKGDAQIVSLGAGSDARYWRFSKDVVDGKIARYLELDFPATVATKIAAIRKAAALKSTLGDIINIKTDDLLETPNYTLAGCDLRHLDALKARLTCLDSRRPTLILAECVLSYMPPHTSHDVIRTIAQHVDPNVDVAAVSYEMCVAGDRHEAREVTEQNIGKFGKIMLRNLETRGLSLLGARASMTLDAQVQRLTNPLASAQQPANQCSGSALSLRQVWLHSLAPHGRDRLSRIEGLDEVEELELLLACYAVAWAVRPGSHSTSDLQAKISAAVSHLS